MSKIKLDLSQFKHVRSNAKTTTLQHKDGHTLTIAHNSLSPDSQAQLQQLAKITETPLESDEMMHKGSSLAEGGEIKLPEQPSEEKKDESPVKKHIKNAGRVMAESMESSSAPSTPMIGGAIEFAKGGKVNAPNQKLAESKKVPPQTSYAMPPATPMAQGGNAGEQRKKIFGTQSSPAKPEMRSKHMEHISKYAEKAFGLKVNPSGGKINPKTGQRRDENPELGVDKPDWRSGQLESQSNPDAMVHELAHLLLLPKGVGLKEGQKLMDKQYADVQKNYGYMKQKRSQGEIQPMAMEQILRRHMGLPANQNSVPVKEGEGPRTAVDTGELAGTRVQKGNKTVDLIRQSRFLSPENKQRLDEFTSGKIKFHPDYGWQENPEALGAMSRLYKEEHPESVKKAMADGGEVSSVVPTSDPSTWFTTQTPEAKPSPEQSQQIADTMEKNPMDQATHIDPQMVDQAMDMAGGTIGAVKEIGTIGKMAATPQSIMPAIKDTTAKLGEAVEKYGLDHQVTKSLYEKLNGLHNSLQKYMKADGGRIGYDDGGTVPPALSEDEPDDVAAVPTEFTPSENPALTPEQAAYKQGHDADLRPSLSMPAGPVQAGIGIALDRMKGATPEERERHAAEAGLNNIAVMKEDKQTELLKKEEEKTRLAKINAQLQANGLPPLPGTNEPTAINPVPEQPALDHMATLNSTQAPKAPGDEFDQYEGIIGKGYKNALTGIQQAADVAGQRGVMEQQALERDMMNKQTAAQAFQDSFKELNNERMAHISDIQKGYIDPAQYWKGTKNPATGEMEGGHSKLMAGIGMILAGFNPTSNPNQAIQMLQYQMNRNLEAQKANLGAKQNLLTANLHQFQNLRDATDMTRIMQHDMVANELQQAAAKTASPAAKAAALQNIGQLQMNVAPIMQQFAMRRAFMKLANSGMSGSGATEQMLNYMEASGMPQAKEMRERYVPGLGIAATPVPQEIKDRITAYQNVERLMNQSMQFAKQHEYNLSAMSPSERAAGETIRNELMSQIRTAEKQGVYKESEARFMEKTLGGNPAAFFSAVRTQPKLLEMQQMKTNEYHSLLQNLGGGLLRNAQAVHAQVHSAPQNVVHDANGQPFTRQIINGKAYMIPVGPTK